jgi:hypothetical protein
MSSGTIVATFFGCAATVIVLIAVIAAKRRRARAQPLYAVDASKVNLGRVRSKETQVEYLNPIYDMDGASRLKTRVSAV